MSTISLEERVHPQIIVVTPVPREDEQEESAEIFEVELHANGKVTFDIPTTTRESTSSSVKSVSTTPLHTTMETRRPSTAATPSKIDPQLISDVLAMRPTLVLGRERAQTAATDFRRGNVHYRSFQHKRPHTTANTLGDRKVRRSSSLPMLAPSTTTSTSSTVTIEEIEEPEEEFGDDDPFQRGDIRRSTRRIKDRIRTYKQEQMIIPKEVRHSIIADFKYVKWPKIKSRLQVIRSWELWKGHMKEVEGHFGTAVVSYFIFLRWLFLMNVVIFALWFGLVVIPNIAYISFAQPPNIPSTLSCSSDTTAFPFPNYTCAEDFNNGLLITENITTNFYLLSGPGYTCNSTNLTTFSVRSCLYERQTIGGVIYDVAHMESPTVVMASSVMPTQCQDSNGTMVNMPRVARLCSSNIDPHVEWYQYIIDFALGAGIFNDTVLFHGRYSDSTVFVYNLPLAFMLLIVVVYAISVMLLVYNLGKAYNESYVQFGKKRHINFCNKVFSSWDFNITDVNTAKLKRVQIKTDLLEELADYEQRSKHRTSKELAKVIVIRIFTNLFTLLVLIGGGVAIFFAAQFSLTTQSSESVIALEGLVSPVIITAFNIILPFVFSFLAQFERFKTQSGEIKMTLFRAIIVRLASLIVLTATLYIVIQCTQDIEAVVSTSTGGLSEGTCGLSPVNISNVLSNINTNRECPVCWESYIGQEFYKLALTNFLLSAATTIAVETARNVVSRIRWKGIGEKIGKGNFNIPRSILDLIYTQALLWLGFVFTPLSPAIILVTTFVLFYVKKYSLIWNLTPSKRKTFRAARTNFVFIALMLLTLFMVIIIIGFAIASLRPSSICGPFRGRTYMYSIIADLIAEIENCSARQALEYFGSLGFLLPLFILLLLIIYAQQVTLRARKKRFELIKKQLILEGANVTHIVGTLDEVLNKLNTQVVPAMDPGEQANLKDRMKRAPQNSVALSQSEEFDL